MLRAGSSRRARSFLSRTALLAQPFRTETDQERQQGGLFATSSGMAAFCAKRPAGVDVKQT
jgi:hypothetical protein